MSLIDKLKRRNVFRSALAYAVAAWLLVEVMELVTETFGAPAWVLQVFVSLAMIGIVPVVLFSWMYEITPEGIKREGQGGVDHSADTTHKLNVAIAVMLAIAIGLFGWQQFLGGRGEVPATSASQVVPAAKSPGDMALPVETPDSDLAPMVAALPFTSVSLDGESDFFAVGVHDDLLTQLAKMESMRVISRTSVLEYRGTTKNIRDIGDELGADIILEGGVQAAGGRIRINAQLIDAATDEHLWAETYDREMTAQNIFDVQREIAGAIANALNTTLTRQDDEELRIIPTDNMAAYRAWHRALDIRNTPGLAGWNTKFAAALREAIELDPEFVRPRAELVGSMALDAVGQVKTDPEIAARAEAELEEIRRIAPESAEYLIAQTYYIYYILRDYDHAYDVVNQALARNPSDIHVLDLKSWIERRQMNMVERLDTMWELLRMDPRNPERVESLALNYLVLHRFDEAEKVLDDHALDTMYAESIRLYSSLRHDGDFERHLGKMRVRYAENPDRLRFVYLDALYLNRLFDEAAALQDGFDLDETLTATGFPHRGWAGLLSFWFQGNDAELQRYVSAAETFLDRHRDSEGNLLEISDYLLEATIAAVKGDRDTTMNVIRAWTVVAQDDPTELLFFKHSTCRLMAMVGAANQAVSCLRQVFVEPSGAMPFVDPFMPEFDSIREEPGFMALMADIEAGMYD